MSWNDEHEPEEEEVTVPFWTCDHCGQETPTAASDDDPRNTETDFALFCHVCFGLMGFAPWSEKEISIGHFHLFELLDEAAEIDPDWFNDDWGGGGDSPSREG